MKFSASELFTTYSIVARDSQTGQLGVAVQTHQMCVGVLVPWLLPGIGAIATQSLVNVSFGPMGLTMLQQGIPAQRVIDALVSSDPGANRRQVAVVDNQGNVSAWTGDGCIAEAGHHIGDGYSVQANMMSRPTVISAMRDAYESASGDPAQRMTAALQAAEAQEGDIRGRQSAALMVVPADSTVNEVGRYVYNFRVDEHDNPTAEMARLVRLRSAQILDSDGHQAFATGERDKALELWAKARERAPELEELAFWSAITLADAPAGDVATAAAILKPAIHSHELRERWIDLIRRLAACKLIEHDGVAEELIQALEA